MRPEFEPLVDPDGVLVRAPIENAQFELYTDRVVDPVETDTDQFVLPVDSAVAIEAGRLEIPRLVNVFLWDDDGTMVGESVNQQHTEHASGWYSLDLPLGPMKLQIVAESGLTVRRSENATQVEFAGETPLLLGVRSLHESPAGTITIGDDVEDAMRAVALSGSALKTTSPERSFPSLRGHPPLIERADGFDAPDAFERPETDVAIEIPRDYGDLFRVSSLAYYLGADVVPGDDRVLDVAGERYDLDTDRGFEAEVSNLLKHVFFLDCVTRTEGFYPVNLHERNVVEPDLPFDSAAVYDATPAERLRAYLDVSYEVTAPHLPQWKLTADIEPDPDHVEAIPFVANELATVRIPEDDEDPDVHDEPEALTEFYRTDGATVRSTAGEEAAADWSNVVKPDETDAIEHAWIAEGFPLGASKTRVESYLRRLDRPARDQDSISIDIVCNEDEMSEEDIVEQFYGTRDVFEFDIAVHYDLTGDELADVLRKDTDFLHYIGHVDERGFQCADGMFDARTLEEVNVDAFLLNACKSYEQGDALVERGSYGGIVTLANISNDPAVRIGRALARLLNNGFTLQAGLSVARHVTLFGNKYITIGDGTLQLVQSKNGTPVATELTETTGGYKLTIRGYPTPRSSIGSMYQPHIKENTSQYLNSGIIDTFEVTVSDLREFFNRGVAPVLYDGGLTWSDELLQNELS
ncbi:uncharacterized protein HHUB_2878 [Halobacterium hubeiense]|uniref:Uncharacterized protein n=1 Tax=Halobacterium hubeiense TaxID=1407499 RepID=A0A0U5HVF4_9EURY|nr:hypothetical protein [Halobacterium hubeiense]CQH58999.1 uncharacterized protein HHUB_2878 [Halobacterium hubeiense]